MGIGWLGSGGAGIWLLAVTGFGWAFSLELEQPTVTEQTIRTAAKMSALVFLLEILEPQATERASLVPIALLRVALMRVMLIRVIGLPPADLRRLG